MAILGGALLPMVHAFVMDVSRPALGYVVPGVCLALVAAYALFDLRTRRDSEVEDSNPATT
jgi:FHS family L-fucose permease-like MFS transporter